MSVCAHCGCSPRPAAPKWVAEEHDDIVVESLAALAIACQESHSDFVIPGDLAFSVITSLADLRIRPTLHPEVLQLLLSWVRNFEDCGELDAVEAGRIDRLIVHGEGGLVGG